MLSDGRNLNFFYQLKSCFWYASFHSKTDRSLESENKKPYSGPGFEKGSQTNFFDTQRASQIIVSLASFEGEKKTVIFKTKGDKQIFN